MIDMNREVVLSRMLLWSAAIAGAVAAWLVCLELSGPKQNTLYQESILLPCFLAAATWCCFIALLCFRSGTMCPTQFTFRTLLIATTLVAVVLGLVGR